MTMKMGIESRLMEKIPEIVAVEAISDEDTGLELMEENIEKEFWNIFLHQQVNLHWRGFASTIILALGFSSSSARFKLALSH
ncbi:hypothetical protein OIU84_023184 [Salix udensis]|uniref:Uncharacterized protein n=1 Tax=Salix udensis TaxID=889485 RepID=A0AAD6KQ80_9ROSI|nr:hypothetical protein OIU84_023184 [Salix udensis]